MTEFDNICVVDDCDKNKAVNSHYCARHRDRLPRGATKTLLNFDQPGFIHITITPPGAVTNFNLEDVISKLECDAYNQNTITEWEKVFARLAHLCRRKLPLRPLSSASSSTVV